MTKNYVVVGGLSGIGQSIVNTLSSDSCSSIIATSRTLEDSIVHPSNVSVMQLDLLDPSSIDCFVESVTTVFPWIDGLEIGRASCRERV